MRVTWRSRTSGAEAKAKAATPTRRKTKKRGLKAGGRQRNGRESMLRRTFMSLTMGTAIALSGAFNAAAQAEELTIFWAEWDPANYLQELANI